MKEGRITAFLFHVVEGVSRWTRREILANAGQPYIFIPVVECKAWADLLATKPRSERKKEEFGDKDFVGRFLIPKPRKVERPGKGGRKQ